MAEYCTNCGKPNRGGVREFCDTCQKRKQRGQVLSAPVKERLSATERFIEKGNDWLAAKEEAEVRIKKFLNADDDDEYLADEKAMYRALDAVYRLKGWAPVEETRRQLVLELVRPAAVNAGRQRRVRITITRVQLLLPMPELERLSATTPNLSERT